MQIALAGVLLKSITFVTSTFSKTETFYVSLLFAMDTMMLQYMLISLRDIKIIQVKGNTYRVINNLLYSESYCLYESSHSTGKFGAL